MLARLQKLLQLPNWKWLDFSKYANYHSVKLVSVQQSKSLQILFVELNKCFKMSIYCRNRLRYSRDRPPKSFWKCRYLEPLSWFPSGTWSARLEPLCFELSKLQTEVPESARTSQTASFNHPRSRRTLAFRKQVVQLVNAALPFSVHVRCNFEGADNLVGDGLSENYDGNRKSAAH